MINFKTVIRIIGILLLLETVMLLLCSGVSFYYQDEALVDFWVSAGITAGAGLLLAAMGKGGDRQLTRRDGYVLVSFAWVASRFSVCYRSTSVDIYPALPTPSLKRCPASAAQALQYWMTSKHSPTVCFFGAA